MELKYSWVGMTDIRHFCSNRTFMELKLVKLISTVAF